MITCRDVAQLKSRERETPLTWKQRLAIRFHVMRCVCCPPFIRQMEFLQNVLEKEFREGALEQEGPEKLPEETREQIKSEISSASGPDAKS